MCVEIRKNRRSLTDLAHSLDLFNHSFNFEDNFQKNWKCKYFTCACPDL